MTPNLKHQFFDMIIERVESLPAEYNKGRVLDIVNDMLEKYGNEIEFVGSISVLSHAISKSITNYQQN